VRLPLVRPFAGLVLILGVVIAGCGSPPSTASDVAATQRPPTKGPQGGPGTAEPLNTIEGLVAGKPIIAGDFADPFVLDVGRFTYTYATNTTDANVPVFRTEGYKTAFYLGDAMPTLPSWTSKGFIWAPAVWARPDGQYVLYYAGADNASGKMCVSRALGPSPAGPFTDDSTAPFVCPLDLGGAIDPAVVVDRGKPYLLYKSDGNCCGIPTSLWSVPLSDDGLSLDGQPTRLLGDDESWEGGNTEAPSMVAVGDKYLLFYSANDWSTADYAVGYATCDSVTGPCTKAGELPWLRSTENAKGPGGQEFFAADGQVWMVYHGWLPGQVDTPNGERRLFLDVVTVGADGEPERIGAERTTLQLVWWAVGVVVVVVAVLVLLRVLRRRRASRPTPAE
jgi:hypothetical protein